MNNAVLLFHQGWTDIVNSLGLINYYSNRCNELILIVRQDAASLINYYLRQFKNVTPHFYPKEFIENNLGKLAEHYYPRELLFFGVYDVVRKDKYVGQFSTTLPKTFFVEKFFVTYGIDYINRIECFKFQRDLIAEQENYEIFTNRYGSKYILYHEDRARNIFIDKSEFNPECTWVDLNGISDVFLDYLLVLQNANSIHCLDSVWGAVSYQLDASLGLLKYIPIEVRCLRGHREMFLRPVHLPNWSVV